MKRFFTLTLISAGIAFGLGLLWAQRSFHILKHFRGPITLKVLCDENYLPQELLETYSKRSGVTFQFWTYNKPSEFVRQVANAGPDIDVMCFPSFLTKSLIDTQVLREMNPQELENFAQVSVDFHNLPFDPNFEYSIPLFWNVFGFIAKDKTVLADTWREQWRKNPRKIELWEEEASAYFTMLQTGLEHTQWEDENQTRKLNEWIKNFVGQTHGWTTRESLEKKLNELGENLELIQVPSGLAGDVLKRRPDLVYWAPADGMLMSVILLGQGKSTRFPKEGFDLINWLIDGPQALKVQQFSHGSMVQPVFDGSELHDLQKASYMRNVPLGRLKFNEMELDAIPRFEKLFREAVLKRREK